MRHVLLSKWTNWVNWPWNVGAQCAVWAHIVHSTYLWCPWEILCLERSAGDDNGTELSYITVSILFLGALKGVRVIMFYRHVPMIKLICSSILYWKMVRLHVGCMNCRCTMFSFWFLMISRTVRGNWGDAVFVARSTRECLLDTGGERWGTVRFWNASVNLAIFVSQIYVVMY